MDYFIWVDLYRTYIKRIQIHEVLIKHNKAYSLALNSKTLP